MTHTSAPDTRRRQPELRRVDLAGTAWPVYKLEALAVGAIVFVATVMIAVSLHTAVLAATAATVTLWWVLRIAETRLSHPISARQAPRSQ